MESKELELVLREILQEQQYILKEIKTLAISKSKNPGNDQFGKVFEDKFRDLTDAIKGIPSTLELILSTQYVKSPIPDVRFPQETKAYRFIPKYLIKQVVLGCGAAFLLFFFVCWAAVHYFRESNEFEGHSISLRFLQVHERTDWKRAAFYADSIYRKDPDSLFELVINKEQKRAERIRLMESASEKENEAKELRNRANKVN